MGDEDFSKLAGNSAFLAATAGILYTGTFVAAVKGQSWAGRPSALLLMLTGLFAIPVVVALYERLKTAGSGLALLGLISGVLGGAGALVHGGYELAVILHPADTRLPASQADPRGLLTFAATGIGVYLFARLMATTGTYPKSQTTIGYVLAALLGIIYLGRLLLLDPNQPVLGVSAVAAGLVVGPAWYLRLGTLLKGQAAPQAATSSTIPEGGATT